VDEFYVFAPWGSDGTDPEKKALPGYEGIVYTLVQPALVVLDRSGTIRQKWSWFSFEPRVDFKNVIAEVSVSSGEKVMLVKARPDSADILPSTREGRAVIVHSALPVAPPNPAATPNQVAPLSVAVPPNPDEDNVERNCCSKNCAVM